jgi:ubiquitin carboxyl-terminal hydrolase L3
MSAETASETVVAPSEGEARPTPHWIPLESNPAMLQAFSSKIGLEVEDGQPVFGDCIALDKSMLPVPCHALVFLFPWNATFGPAQKERKGAVEEISPKLFFMKQKVNNACGSIAVMHTLINTSLAGLINLKPGSFITRYYDASKDMSPADRGDYLGTAGNELKEASEAVASDVTVSQTVAPAATASVESHFICFVNVDDHVYELDGLKPGPLNHGKVSETEDFLDIVLRVINTEFTSKDENAAYSVISFGAPSFCFDEDD